MKKNIFITALSFSTLGAFSQVSPMQDYQTTDISQKQANQIWLEMNTDFVKGSQCFNRAMSWAYDIHKKHDVYSKKILIHYTRKFREEIDDEWGFHIAPVMTVQGKDMAFDKGFYPWIYSPLSIDKWFDKFLMADTTKLVAKRIELVEKIKKAKKKLSNAVDETSERIIKERIKKYNNELVYLEITDEDLKEQRPGKIAQLEKWIEHSKNTMDTYSASSSQYRQAQREYLNFSKLLKKVQLDLNYAAHITCKEVTHMSEIDYKEEGIWCYKQEINMFYWGPPQLRLLNYGSYKIPHRADLQSSIGQGDQYARDSFMMEQVWLARKQAFGKNYKEIWKKEYDAMKKEEQSKKEEIREQRRQRRERRAQERARRRR